MDKQVERVTNEAISKGGILFLMYFDAHAPTEEAVKNRLTEMAVKITKEEGVIYAVGTIEPPEKMVYDNETVYSTSCEVRALTKDLRSAVRLASAYGPVYCEVLKPERRIVEFTELQEVMNDVSHVSYELSQYIIRNTLKGDALKSFVQNLKYREKLGEQLRKSGGKREEGNK